MYVYTADTYPSCGELHKKVLQAMHEDGIVELDHRICRSWTAHDHILVDFFFRMWKAFVLVHNCLKLDIQVRDLADRKDWAHYHLEQQKHKIWHKGNNIWNSWLEFHASMKLSRRLLRKWHTHISKLVSPPSKFILSSNACSVSTYIFKSSANIPVK